MFTRFFSPAKYTPCKGSSLSQASEIPLSQIGATAPVQDGADKDVGKRRCNYWRFLCYFLHTLLVALHFILLGVAVSHAEHQIIMSYVDGTWITALSGGLQAFYTLYTCLLVFVTQKLMLSAIFSRTKKLTHIHDMCGAWAGLGAALSALWQQTKVASSVLPIALVTVYFTCIAVLHVTSSTLMQFQIFDSTTAGVFQVWRTWPDASVDLASLDWMTISMFLPFLDDFFDNQFFGLVNNTFYDSPMMNFVAVTVPATTLNANCGLLTNLSIHALEDVTWSVNASMSLLGPITITVSDPPLLNEIWFSPSIQCNGPICSNFILYLISAEIGVDDSVDGNRVYINGTYHPPGGTAQTLSTPVHFVACSLNATNHTVTIDSSGNLLDSAKQPADVAWSAFSPTGDLNLTSAISYAMTSANSLPSSPYCQPTLSYPALWTNITAFNAHMRSALGMGVSHCFGTPVPQYTSTPSLLTRGQFESTVSQIAAEFIWLAGELGSTAGGFDSQKLEYPLALTVEAYSLNINILPVIFALCASAILLLIVVCVLWRCPPAMVSGDGVLEIMWFGSCSQVLRNHLGNVQSTSLDSLRASSMFETIFWTCSAHGHEGSSSHNPVLAPSHDVKTNTSGSRSLRPSQSESENDHSSDIRFSRPRPPHTSNTYRMRNLCYIAHIMLVALHVMLLGFFAHHPEQSIVIPFHTKTMTVGLSAILQAIYTLYSALLVFLMQRLAMFKIVCERRRLTTVHDISRAWTGIGAAFHILWQQRKGSSSTGGIITVAAYLSAIVVLHITSSSIMQWQSHNPFGAIQMYRLMPDSAMNISQLGWVEIFPVASLIAEFVYMPTPGLSNATLIDTAQNESLNFPTTPPNATILKAQCGLVTNLTLSSRNSQGEYEISFLDGYNNGTFLEPPIWKDVVHVVAANTECAACPQTLFYMITTGIEVDDSVHDPVSVELNWTYTPLGGNPQTSTTLTYFAACSLSAQTVPVNDMPIIPAPSTSWSAWSAASATNLSLGMVTALSKDVPGSFPMFFQGNSSSNFTYMDSYIMSSLGLNLSNANTTSISQSGADPSVTLSPWQLENLIAHTAATFLWTAGQLGESGGGFQRTMGESPGMIKSIEVWRLHLNTIPVVLASMASFLSFILAVIIIGKGPSREHPTSISGTSVLECLWLEAHSELLHSRLQTVEEPGLDALRAAGMFEICLGDIGRSSYPEAKQPILELADE